jgi:hypothetical protein
MQVEPHHRLVRWTVGGVDGKDRVAQLAGQPIAQVVGKDGRDRQLRIAHLILGFAGTTPTSGIGNEFQSSPGLPSQRAAMWRRAAPTAPERLAPHCRRSPPQHPPARLVCPWSLGVGWATPSGSGIRGARIHARCAVVSAPTRELAFARWCFTVECDSPKKVCRSLLRTGHKDGSHRADLTVGGTVGGAGASCAPQPIKRVGWLREPHRDEKVVGRLGNASRPDQSSGSTERTGDPLGQHNPRCGNGGL